MKAGDAIAAMAHRVDARAMAIMAQILHDPNPIHLDPAAVRAAGLGDRTINQGPANLGYVVNMLIAAFPGFRLASLDSQYLANVRDGDEVLAAGRIVESSEDRIECEAWLGLADGQTAVGVRAVLLRRESA